MAKKYDCYVEEEEDPSVVGAGMLARRVVADIGPPGDNRCASAAWGFAVATSQEGAKGHLDFGDAIGLPGGEYRKLIFGGMRVVLEHHRKTAPTARKIMCGIIRNTR